MGDGKVEITLGSIAIKCEGSEGFLQKELPKLLNAFAEFHNKTHGQLTTQPESNAVSTLHEQTTSTPSVGEMGMNYVCQKLSAKTTRDVALAAAARLKFVKLQQTFSRNDILAEMKKATDYFDKNMRNNLTKTIRGMVKADILKEVSTDTYSISASQNESVRSKLA